MADKALTLGGLTLAGGWLCRALDDAGGRTSFGEIEAWNAAVRRVSHVISNPQHTHHQDALLLLRAGAVMAEELARRTLGQPDRDRLALEWSRAVEKVIGVPDDLQGLDVTALQAACPKATLAPSLLIDAADAIENRASQRDKPGGERSMRTAVATFNALTGQQISEREGWVFMAILKLARAQGGKHTRDDYVDGAAYLALACESVEQETA